MYSVQVVVGELVASVEDEVVVPVVVAVVVTVVVADEVADVAEVADEEADEADVADVGADVADVPDGAEVLLVGLTRVDLDADGESVAPEAVLVGLSPPNPQ